MIEFFVQSYSDKFLLLFSHFLRTEDDKKILNWISFVCTTHNYSSPLYLLLSIFNPFRTVSRKSDCTYLLAANLTNDIRSSYPISKCVFLNFILLCLSRYILLPQQTESCLMFVCCVIFSIFNRAGIITLCLLDFDDSFDGWLELWFIMEHCWMKILHKSPRKLRPKRARL